MRQRSLPMPIELWIGQGARWKEEIFTHLVGLKAWPCLFATSAPSNSLKILFKDDAVRVAERAAAGPAEVPKPGSPEAVAIRQILTEGALHLGYAVGWLAQAMGRVYYWGPDFSPLPVQIDLGAWGNYMRHALCLSRKTYEALDPLDMATAAAGRWNVPFNDRPDRSIASAYAKSPVTLRRLLTCDDYETCDWDFLGGLSESVSRSAWTLDCSRT